MSRDSDIIMPETIFMRGHHLTVLYIGLAREGHFGNYIEDCLRNKKIMFTDTTLDFICATCKKEDKGVCNSWAYRAADTILVDEFGLNMAQRYGDDTFLGTGSPVEYVREKVVAKVNQYDGRLFWRHMNFANEKLKGLLKAL